MACATSLGCRVKAGGIKSFVIPRTAIEAVQLILEFNQAGFGFGIAIMVGELLVVTPAIIGQIHIPMQAFVVAGVTVLAV